MNSQNPSNGTVLLAALLGIVIGGVGGFYWQFWTQKDSKPSLAPDQQQSQRARPSTTPSAGPPAVGMAGSGQQPGIYLARTIRYLDVLQEAQGKGLTAEQAAKILPILQRVEKEEPLSAEAAERYLSEIMATLTEAQKNLFQRMSPFGRPQAPRAQTGPPSVPMAAGLATAGPGGAPMAGGADPERPFADERNRAALTNLMENLKKSAQ